MNLKTAQQLHQLSTEGYTQIAADFARTRQGLFWPPLKKIMDNLVANSRILDLGCGTGRLLAHIDSAKFEYVGLDNNREMLEIAADKYPGAKFILGDILNLDEIDELRSFVPFDCILAVAVWHHLPGKEWPVLAIQKSLSLLAPSGQLVIIVQNFWRQRKYQKMIATNFFKRICGRYPYPCRDLVFPWKNSQGQKLGERYYHAYTKEELKKISHQAGGRIISLSQDKYNYYLTLGPKSF